MDDILNNIPVKPKLLLHICCVGCGVYVSRLLMENYEVILYFYNPNIWPKEEYEARLTEAIKVANKFNLSLINGDYDHARWLKEIKGHEKDPEKGERCLICYKFRLGEAFRKAKELDCNYLTTTLTTSPHKNAQAINEIGERLSENYNIKFLSQDFKKQDGFKKSSALSKELGLYRQNYCGCEFSRRGA